MKDLEIQGLKDRDGVGQGHVLECVGSFLGDRGARTEVGGFLGGQEMKAFVVNTHDEYGPEDLHVTLDFEKIPEIVAAIYKDHIERDRSGYTERAIERYEAWLAEWQAGLDEFMKSWDGELADRCKIQNGWGGIQISVVEIT